MKLNLLSILFAFIATTTLGQSAGNCLHFNGTNNNISTTLPTVFNNVSANDLTIEAWVHPEGNVFSRILFAQSSTSNFVSLSVGVGNVVYFYVNNTHSQVSNAGLPANQWTHVACTWRGATGQIEIYFNGILQAGAGGGSSSTGTDNLMTIGSRTNNAQYFPGRIDELRIWDVARTPCEISAGVNTYFNTPQPNLVASYSFNQGVAGGSNVGNATLYDLNITYNGTMNNFALSGATSNWIASGASITSTNQQTAVVNGVDTQASCSPITWIDGNTYATNNNTATYLLPGASTAGCDSLVTLNFTLLQPSTGTDVLSACEPYTWIDGNTYSSSNNTATYTVVGGAANGCDSIVTLDLTMLSPSAGVDVQAACESFTWIDGNTYTSDNNVATHTIVGGAANGCDSVVTLNLSILSPTAGTDVQTACGPFTWIDGNTYTSNNNTAMFTVVGGASSGCDSIVSLDLTVNSVDVGTSTTNNVIAADAIGATYQWLDCDNGMMAISGETNATFAPAQNGNYAVMVTQNACTDTSACVAISTIGLIENSFEELLSVYPNPTNGVVNIEFAKLQSIVDIRVFGLDGKEVQSTTFSNVINTTIILDQPAGIYFMEISDRSEAKAILRIVRN